MIKLGEKIWITKLAKLGIIKRIKPNSQFEIEVEGLLVKCSLDDISLEKPKKLKKQKSYKISPKQHHALKPQKNPKALLTIDLHGQTVKEALRNIEKRISDAIIADLEKIEIIHGVGTGALLKATHQYLSTLNIVSRYQLDPINPGVTWVYF